MNIKQHIFRLGSIYAICNMQNGVGVPPWLFDNILCAASVERLRNTGLMKRLFENSFVIWHNKTCLHRNRRAWKSSDRILLSSRSNY
jgi:hypothetical protein